MMVLVLQVLTKNKNIKQLLIDVQGGYRKDFFTQEKQSLENNDPCDTYNITLLFKLIQKICGLKPTNHDRWKEPYTLENNLRELKEHRNDLGHETLALTAEKLKDLFEHLEHLCREVLIATGLRVRLNVMRYVQTMEQDLEEILTGSIDMWEPYREGLFQLQIKQRIILVTEGKLEIKELAKKLRVLNPFVWLLEDKFAHMDVGNIYTNISIDHQGQVNAQELLECHLPSGDYPDVLIIVGAPGIGKTSLVRFLINDWALAVFSVTGINNFDLVLPIELRYVTCSTVQQLLCEEILPQACHHLESKDVIPTLKKLSILWLVDGFDEATDVTKSLIMELLKKFPISKIVITTRNDCQQELQLLVDQIHLSQITCQIKGFSPGQWNIYAEKLFSVSVKNESKRQQSCSEFLQFMKEREGDMWGIFSVPLFVAMLVTLWLENSSVVTAATTATRLYHTLLDLTINRMIRRLHVTILGLTECELRHRINRFLDLLGEILWENLQNYRYVLTDVQLRRLDELCKDLNLPFKESLSPFFLLVVKMTTTGTTVEYRPLHKTVQEFLAARAFCKSMVDQDCDVFTLAAQWKVKHRKNIKEPESYRHGLRLYWKDKFVMDKLHEGNEIVFDDCNNMIGSCYCPYILDCSQEWHEEFGEFERFHCSWYFMPITYTSLVFQFMCGFLKMNNLLSQARAEQIIYIAICTQDKIRQYSLWLNLIHETDRDLLLLEELRKQITPYVWVPWSFDLSLVGRLLKFVTPESLYVHFCDLNDINPASYDNSDFFNSLQVFSTTETDIYLSFQDEVIKDDLDFTHRCLSVLLGNEATCRLIGLDCHFNSQSLNLLCRACHLEELEVIVDNLEDLNILAQAVKCLPKLNHLGVCLNFSIAQVPIDRLPTFQLSQCVTYESGAMDNIYYVMRVSGSRDEVIFKPHKCSPPKCKSHKLLRYKKISGSCTQETINMSAKAFTPYPLHLQIDKTMAIDCQTMWNFPPVHCHHQCAETNYEPLLCADLCCHIPWNRDEQTSFHHHCPRSKKEWLHHHRAIRYHRRSMKRLRVCYNHLWNFIYETYKPKKETYQKIYDPQIRMFCYELKDQQLWHRIDDLNIFSLKVCELYIYEHKISIQQHRKLLTHVLQPNSDLASPVVLTFKDANLEGAKSFGAMVRKLCPNPRAVYIRHLGNAVNAAVVKDFVNCVWDIAYSVPNVQMIDILFVSSAGEEDLVEPHNPYELFNYAVTSLVEKSAPKFRFSLSWK